MGADLFDSNVAAMASALVIAQSLSGGEYNNISMVFCYAILGLLASIIGIANARIGKNGNPTHALNMSTYVTTGIFLVLTAVATAVFDGFSWRIWGASTVGLIVGVIIGITTDYFTDDSKLSLRKWPTLHSPDRRSPSFPAFLTDLFLPFRQWWVLRYPPFWHIRSASPWARDTLFRNLHGGSGNAFHRRHDHLQRRLRTYRGQCERSRGDGRSGRGYDPQGGRTGQRGKYGKSRYQGILYRRRGPYSMSLLGAFMSEVNVSLAEAGRELITGFDIMEPTVFFGVLIGAAIPAVFSAMLILGVDKNAQRMVAEIHRQFDTIPGLREGKKGVKAEYGKCIDIATTGALKELIPRRTDEHPLHSGGRIHRRSPGDRRFPSGKHRQRTSSGSVYVQRRRSLG